MGMHITASEAAQMAANHEAGQRKSLQAAVELLIDATEDLANLTGGISAHAILDKCRAARKALPR